MTQPDPKAAADALVIDEAMLSKRSTLSQQLNGSAMQANHLDDDDCDCQDCD
jgi:hypothetical protein